MEVGKISIATSRQLCRAKGIIAISLLPGTGLAVVSHNGVVLLVVLPVDRTLKVFRSFFANA